MKPDMRPRDPETWRAILEEAHRGWLRRWLVWAAVCLAGFLAIRAAGLWESWVFYAWAIGGVLGKAAWDRVRYHRVAARHTGRDESGRA